MSQGIRHVFDLNSVPQGFYLELLLIANSSDFQCDGCIKMEQLCYQPVVKL